MYYLEKKFNLFIPYHSGQSTIPQSILQYFETFSTDRENKKFKTLFFVTVSASSTTSYYSSGSYTSGSYTSGSYTSGSYTSGSNNSGHKAK